MAMTGTRVQLEESQYMLYRGKPFVRDAHQICYGDMQDPYVLHLMVVSTKKVGDIEVPDAVFGEICSTDTAKTTAERSVKTFNKSGLYEALEFGISQLNRYNKKL